jgi:hypothetical protein
VHRRGHVLWFRKAIPADLVDRLGCSDIRRSLRTSNMRIARQRAWAFIVRIEEAFAVIRSAGLRPDAHAALRAIFTRIMDDVDPDRASWAERSKYLQLIESLSNTAGTGQEIRLSPRLADEAVSQVSPSLVAEGPSHDILSLIKSAVQDAMVDERARRPLSTFIETYLASKEKLRPKTRYELGVKIRVFMEAMGDLPVYLYTRQTLKDYCALLEKMPKDAVKHLKTDNLQHAIALNARRRVPIPPIVRHQHLCLRNGFAI